jgi:hypothetical protein
MKVLISGEGSSEIGDLNFKYDRKRGRYVHHDGWMHYFVRRILDDDNIEFLTISTKDLAVFPGRKYERPLPPGHGLRALYAIETAEAEGCEIVVFAIDADTNEVKEWKALRTQIMAGFSRSRATLKAVACLPMSASESWLLSDAATWEKIGLRDVDILPGKPETIWGARNDPDGNHPHRYFARVCKRAQARDNAATRWEIAARSSIKVLAAKCPISFVAFRDDLGS